MDETLIFFQIVPTVFGSLIPVAYSIEGAYNMLSVSFAEG